MIANRMMNVVLRQPIAMAFMFSTKKKQMELTIKTPYRTSPLSQKLSPNHSQDSAELSPKLNNQPLSFKTEPLPLFTSFLQVTSNSNSTDKPRESLMSTCTPADGSSFIRKFAFIPVITHVKLI